MSINYLSPLVEKQLPGFVREENPNFVTFLEKYYEWMETSGKPIYENYNLLNAKDIDLANDFFIKQIKEELLPSFPEEILLDDVKFLKTINQFYRSKGTPDSIKFLFKILYNEDIDIYFPSNEILKLSDGKWVLPLALRVETNDPNVFNLVKTQVRGTISDATAVVEKVVSSVDRALGIQYIELFVSNVNRLFTTGETLTSSYIDGDDTITVNAKLVGSLSEVKIDPKNRGLFYKDNDPRGLFYYPEDIEVQYGGDPVTFVGGLNPDENANPKPAEAVVGEVLKGQINEIITIDGGFGFRRSIYPNTSIIDFKGGFASGRLGQESKAEIILVDEKTYRTINVGNSEIQSFYSNTINSIDNVANNKTINEITTKQSLNLYPIAFLSAVSSGGGYSSRPDIETYSLYNEGLDDELVISSSFVTRKTNVIRDNTQDLTQFLEKGDIIRLFVKNRFEQVETVQEVTSNTITIGSSFETNINNLQVYKVLRRNLVQLGSLGRIKILNGGSNYNVGNYLIFTANGRGYGANAQVTQVHAGNNGIKAVEFNESSAYVRGGEGYTSAEFPIITVNSANGSNAQLVVSEILGDGEKVEISTSRIGAVSKIKVISYGYDYTSAPIVSLRNADLYLSNVTQGLLFTSNSKVYQGTSNTNTTFEAYFDKYVTGNSHVRIFNYIGTFDDTKQLKSFDNTISADIFDYVFFGNGKAKATAKFENGLIRYPGIYLNEDGQPSSEKRFQDSNKYHNFSYVINTENDYKKFSKTLADVLHPTGTKSFVTRIKKFENDVASLVITSNNFITTPLSNTFNVFVGTGIAVVTGSGANVNLASSISVGDTIVFRNLLKTLNGTVSYVSGSNTITGNGTNFINDIYDGQVIRLVSGNSEVVAYVTNANSIITQNTLTSTVSNGTISLYYDEVDTVTFVNANTIFVSTLFEDTARFVSANLKIDLGAASSLRDIRTTLLIPSINVYAGEANNFTPVSATGGIGGIAKYLVSPVLPDGLVMISSNGNIRGTPTVIKSPTTYTVTALDRRSRGANATFTLGVTPQPLLAVRSIASRTISANTTATAFKPIIPSGGYGSVRYSISPSLSAGVTFDPFTGEIGGIPSVLSAANTYTISMVDDVSQNASNTFVLTVNALPVITSTIISSRTLTANVSNAFTPITATGGYGGLTYNIAPTLPTGLTFNTANGYIFGDTQTTLVANTFTVTANDGTGQSTSNTFSLTISSPPAVIVSRIISTRTLTANTANAFTPVTATGGFGTLTYRISPSLPTGLTFNTANGYINGVTSVLSSSTYTITVSDTAKQNISNTFFMTVEPPALTSTMAPASRNLVTGIANSFNTLTASGGYGQITYSISPSLPTGLSLNTSNGFISGTVAVSTTLTTYTITANDQASQVTSNTFTMRAYEPLVSRSLIASRILNTNVANSFLPVIATSIIPTGNTVNAYYFNGVTSGARLPSDEITLDFNAGNFTIEFWVKANAASQTANSTIIDSVKFGDIFLQIGVGSAISGSAGRISFTAQAPDLPGSKITTTNNYLDDVWHHVACVRNSDTGYIYVDGVLVANSAAGAWSSSTQVTLKDGQIGRSRYNTGINSTDTFTGYLSNIRILNRALYTSAFTPPTTPLTRFNGTILLVNSSGFTDTVNSGQTPKTFTAVEALPNTSITGLTTTTLNLSSTSYYFDGSTQGIRLPITTDLDFGTGNFTVEFWMKGATTQTSFATIVESSSDSSGFLVQFRDNQLYFTPKNPDNGGIEGITSSTLLNDNAWHHVAFVKSSNNGYLFVDGRLEANATGWSAVTSTMSEGQIGRASYGTGDDPDNTYTGYLSDIRFLKGTALYTSAFTPPLSTRITAIANTVLLINGSTVVDSSNLALTLTAKDVLPNVSSDSSLGNFTFSITPSLPTGLVFNTANGFITGNSAQTVIANTYTVSISDGAQTSSNTFIMSVVPALTMITGVTFKSLTANSADPFTPANVSGGATPYTYSVSPSLPTGLTFDTANGYINGVASVLSSNTSYTVNVTDYLAQTTSNTFTMNVSAAALTSTLAFTSRNLVTGIANSFNTLTASGGYGQITYNVSPTLPTGLTFNTSNGFVNGTVTSNTESISYTVTANDQSSQTTSNTFTMKVYTQLLTRTLIASRTLNTNVANSFLPVIAVGPSSGEGATAYVYYFDGVNNGVRLPFSGDLGLTGDHATEFWIKANAASQTANATIIDATQTRTGYQISVGASITGGAGRISFTPQGSTYKIIATGNYLDDVWHHVACVRYNNTGYIYVDGVLVANSAAGAWAGATNSYLFGGQIGRGRYGLGLGLDDTFTGYLSNFRVTNYLPVYTSNFTRPTSPFANPVPGVDPVVLLVNGATFTSSNSNPAVTFTAKDVLPTITTDSTLFSTPAVNLTSGITYSISPTLPTGLTFNTSNGFITGNTAQTVIANTYTVTVSDASGQANSNTFIMSVLAPLSISTGTTLKYNYIGQDPNFTPATASGGATPYTYSVDGLGGNTIPSGTTLNTSNGKISGTSVVKPGVAASFYPYSSTIKIIVTDAVGQQVSSANIEFVLPGKQIPTSFTSRAVRSIIANSTYASINIGVVTGGLGNLNSYLVPASIGESNAALYPLAFSNNVTGMTYSFVPASNTIFISGTPTKAMGVQYDESDNFLGVINDPSTEYQIYAQSFDETRITTKGWNSGPFNLNIQATKFYVNTTTSTLIFNTGDIVSSTPITVSGGYGVNGNITFALSGNTLPTGLEFITSNGAIVGVPGVGYSTNTFTVTANDDSFQTASNTFTLQVIAPTLYANTTTPAITFNTNEVNTFTPITVSGGYGNKTFAISGNTLPDGLTFITSNGAITGSAISVSNANTFTITANDDTFQTASNTFTLQVNVSTLTLLVDNYYQQYNAGGYGVRGFEYTANVESTWQRGSEPIMRSNGGSGTITFTVTSNTLPSGTSLLVGTVFRPNTLNTVLNYTDTSALGIPQRYIHLQGTPDLFAEAPSGNIRVYTVTANDDTGQSVSNTFAIGISPRNLTIIPIPQ